MKKIFMLVFMLVVVIFFSQSFAQDNKGGDDVFASKVKKNKETGKYKLPARDPQAPKPGKARGDCCTFTNWTGFTVYFWVDTIYKGSIAAWGDIDVCFNNGDESWYMRTAGSTYEWQGIAKCPRNIRLRSK